MNPFHGLIILNCALFLMFVATGVRIDQYNQQTVKPKQIEHD